MTYPEFIQELINRFGEERGTLMALRAEVGFLRRFIEQQNLPEFKEQQESMVEDFLKRHPATHVPPKH
jgi:hypothetical protein